MMKSLVRLCALIWFTAFFGHANAIDIKSKSDFNKYVVGKKLLDGRDTVKIYSNGSAKGIMRGKNFAFRWTWFETYFCHRATNNSVKKNTCQKISINEKLVSFTPRGKGKSRIWIID